MFWRLFRNAPLRSQPRCRAYTGTLTLTLTPTLTQVCTPACTAVCLLSQILPLLSHLLAALQVSGKTKIKKKKKKKKKNASVRPCVRHRQKASLKTHRTWNCLLEAACAISLVVCQSLWFGPQSFMHLKLLCWNDCVPGKPGKSVCFPSRNVVLVLSSISREGSRAVHATVSILASQKCKAPWSSLAVPAPQELLS